MSTWSIDPEDLPDKEWNFISQEDREAESIKPKSITLAYTNAGGISLDSFEFTGKPDKNGNMLAQEGLDSCPCGAKYWENDRCHSCNAHISMVAILPFTPQTDVTLS